MGIIKNIYNKLTNLKFIKWITASRKRKIIFLILVIGIVLLRARAVQNSGLEVEFVNVKRSDFTESITAQGKVNTEKIANLVFLSAGEIEEIYVENGSFVKKGDPIAKIDTYSLYQTYHQAKATLRNTEAILARVYDDIKDNDEDESLTEKETRTAAETAKDSAYRAFAIAERNLSNGKLIAPFDGIVDFGDRISSGAYSSTTSSSFTIVDPTTTYFEAEVNEVDITKLTKDAKAIIALDAYGGQVFEEKIKSIGFINTTTSSGGTAYIVSVTLPENESDRFRLGMNGDVEFVINKYKNVLIVPSTSITEEDSKSFVWTVEGKRAIKREIKIGKSSFDEVEIISGIEEGEKIIKRPPSKIEEGVRVKEK